LECQGSGNLQARQYTPGDATFVTLRQHLFRSGTDLKDHTGLEVPVLQSARQRSAQWRDIFRSKIAARTATRRCHAATRAPCRSTCAMVPTLRATRNRAVPNRR